jgi:hypothetical protein
MNIVLAPHLDDEVIGCYSVLGSIDQIYYFTTDHREACIAGDPRYARWSTVEAAGIRASDVVYIPSSFDWHPMHRKVNRVGLALPGSKRFYSVEMNTPWLEEEPDWQGKKAMLERCYPGEPLLEKWWRFRSIQSFDEVIWASVLLTFEGKHRWRAAPVMVEFLRHLHRHVFHVRTDVQQMEGDRELEYFILRGVVKAALDDILHTMWKEDGMSCEAFARELKRRMEVAFDDRLVRVAVSEDGENGCLAE